VFILTVIFLTFACLVFAQLSGLAAIAGETDPDQLRMVVFIPILLQQCRTGYDCAVVEPILPEPKPQPVCDEKHWWMCE